MNAALDLKETRVRDFLEGLLARIKKVEAKQNGKDIEIQQLREKVKELDLRTEDMGTRRIAARISGMEVAQNSMAAQMRKMSTDITSCQENIHRLSYLYDKASESMTGRERLRVLDAVGDGSLQGSNKNTELRLNHLETIIASQYPRPARGVLHETTNWAEKFKEDTGSTKHQALENAIETVNRKVKLNEDAYSDLKITSAHVTEHKIRGMENTLTERLNGYRQESEQQMHELQFNVDAAQMTVVKMSKGKKEEIWKLNQHMRLVEKRMQETETVIIAKLRQVESIMRAEIQVRRQAEMKGSHIRGKELRSINSKFSNFEEKMDTVHDSFARMLENTKLCFLDLDSEITERCADMQYDSKIGFEVHSVLGGIVSNISMAHELDEISSKLTNGIRAIQEDFSRYQAQTEAAFGNIEMSREVSECLQDMLGLICMDSFEKRAKDWNLDIRQTISDLEDEVHAHFLTLTSRMSEKFARMKNDFFDALELSQNRAEITKCVDDMLINLEFRAMEESQEAHRRSIAAEFLKTRSMLEVEQCVEKMLSTIELKAYVGEQQVQFSIMEERIVKALQAIEVQRSVDDMISTVTQEKLLEAQHSRNMMLSSDIMKTRSTFEVQMVMDDLISSIEDRMKTQTQEKQIATINKKIEQAQDTLDVERIVERMLSKLEQESMLRVQKEEREKMEAENARSFENIEIKEIELRASNVELKEEIDQAQTKFQIERLVDGLISTIERREMFDVQETRNAIVEERIANINDKFEVEQLVDGLILTIEQLEMKKAEETRNATLNARITSAEEKFEVEQVKLRSSFSKAQKKQDQMITEKLKNAREKVEVEQIMDSLISTIVLREVTDIQENDNMIFTTRIMKVQEKLEVQQCVDCMVSEIEQQERINEHESLNTNVSTRITEMQEKLETAQIKERRSFAEAQMKQEKMIAEELVHARDNIEIERIMDGLISTILLRELTDAQESGYMIVAMRVMNVEEKFEVQQCLDSMVSAIEQRERINEKEAFTTNIDTMIVKLQEKLQAEQIEERRSFAEAQTKQEEMIVEKLVHAREKIEIERCVDSMVSEIEQRERINEQEALNTNVDTRIIQLQEKLQAAQVEERRNFAEAQTKQEKMTAEKLVHAREKIEIERCLEDMISMLEIRNIVEAQDAKKFRLETEIQSALAKLEMERAKERRDAAEERSKHSKMITEDMTSSLQKLEVERCLENIVASLEIQGIVEAQSSQNVQLKTGIRDTLAALEVERENIKLEMISRKMQNSKFDTQMKEYQLHSDVEKCLDGLVAVVSEKHHDIKIKEKMKERMTEIADNVGAATEAASLVRKDLELVLGKTNNDLAELKEATDTIRSEMEAVAVKTNENIKELKEATALVRSDMEGVAGKTNADLAELKVEIKSVTKAEKTAEQEERILSNTNAISKIEETAKKVQADLTEKLISMESKVQTEIEAAKTEQASNITKQLEVLSKMDELQATKVQLSELEEKLEQFAVFKEELLYSDEKMAEDITQIQGNIEKMNFEGMQDKIVLRMQALVDDKQKQLNIDMDEKMKRSRKELLKKAGNKVESSIELLKMELETQLDQLEARLS